MRIIAAASLLAIATAAGFGGTPAPAQSQARTAATQGFAAFRDGFIEGWFKLDPATAVYQGRHDFDGQLPDWSAAGLKRQSAFLRQAIDRARGFKDADLTPDERFERDYLIRVAKGNCSGSTMPISRTPTRPIMSGAGSIPTFISRGPMPTHRRG